MNRRVSTWVVVLIAVLGIAFARAPAGAHEKHAAPDTTVAGGTSRPAGVRSPQRPVVGGPPKAAPRPYAMPPPGEAMMEHVHNKVIHFPIALAPAALLLLLADRRKPGLAAAGILLVWLAAAGGVVSYFAGRAQTDAFRGTGKEWLVGVHERWGTAAALSLVAWALLSLLPRARHHIWIAGLVAVAVILAAAYLGGLVAHGE